MVYIFFYRVVNEDNLECFIGVLVIGVIIGLVILLIILVLFLFLIRYLKKKYYCFRGNRYVVKGNLKI